jgi:hypothetical protein
MIVVDASALLEALLRTAAARAVERWLFEPGQTLHVPHLLDLEVAQTIRRYAANGELDGERGRAALADLADFPLRRYPHDFLLPASGTCGTILPPTMEPMSPSPKPSMRRCLRATGGSLLRLLVTRASN